MKRIDLAERSEMPYCSRGAAVTAWHGDVALDVDCDLDVAQCSPSEARVPWGACCRFEGMEYPLEITTTF